MKVETLDVYPPLQLLQHYSTRHHIPWEKLEEIKHEVRTTHHFPDEVYLSGEEALYAIFKLCKIKQQSQNMLLWQKEASLMSSLASWRISKQVYRFAEELEQLLYSQASDCSLPVEVLRRLPFPSLYIESPNLSGNTYHGFFATLDATRDGSQKLTFVLLPNAADKEVLCLYLGLKGEGTLKERFDECIHTFHQSQLEAEMTDLVNFICPIFERMIQLLLYVCAKNADIKPANSHHHTAPKPLPMIKDKYREIQCWGVGMRIINQLNSSRHNLDKVHKTTSNAESERLKGGRSGHHVKPHIRRSHWHIYWTGKKDGSQRQIVLKWIPHLLINVEPNSFNELPTTIRVVK